jgi:Lon protease-like protein
MTVERIPLFPLGLVLLPGMALPLHIFEERYKQMISECLAGNTPFGIVWFDGQTIRPVGCTARVIRVLHRYEDGRMDILTRGEKRFYTEGMIEEKTYMEADVLFIEDAESDPDAEMVRRARTLLVKLRRSGHPADEIEASDLSDPRRLSFAVPAIEGFSHAERQRFLEMTSSAERLQKAVEVLVRILERVQVTQQIRKIIGGNGHPPKDALQKLAAGEEPETGSNG